LAAGAGLANAVGLMAWPMLLWAAWRGRAGGRWLAAIGILTLGYGAAYLHGVAPVAVAADATAASPFAAVHLVKMAGYALAYLGLPLSRMGTFPLPGYVLGATMLVAGTLALVRYGVLVRAPSRLQRIATGFILFSLGGAALAAVGRTDLAPAVNVPVRYTVLVTPLHAGLLALVLPWAVGAARSRARSGAVQVAGAMLGIALLAQQAVGGWSAVSISARMRATIAQYYAGARTPEMATVVYPDLAVADAIVAKLRHEGLDRE